MCPLCISNRHLECASDACTCIHHTDEELKKQFREIYLKHREEAA